MDLTLGEFVNTNTRMFSLQLEETRSIFNRIVSVVSIFHNRIALVFLHKYPRILLFLIFIYCLQLAVMLKYFDTNKVIIIIVIIIIIIIIIIIKVIYLWSWGMHSWLKWSWLSSAQVLILVVRTQKCKSLTKNIE